jgi:hypothetical protein
MQKGYPRVAFLHLFHGGEKQGPCGPCDGDSKAVALQGAAGPRDVAESHFAIATRWLRAPRAHGKDHLAAAFGGAPKAPARSA